MKSISIGLRYRISNASYEALSNLLETTEDAINIGKMHARRYTLRGVPAKVVDFVVTDDVDNPLDERDLLVIEIGKKEGRYDGAVRDRITIRRMVGYQANTLPKETVLIGLDEGVLTIAIGSFKQSYRQLRSKLEDYDLSKIIFWHWNRYYQHLQYADVVMLAEEWALENEQHRSEWTLSEANRSASRALYRLSRDLGWRKLTKREQNKHNINKMWVQADLVAFGHPTGTGEATRRAANGGTF